MTVTLINIIKITYKVYESFMNFDNWILFIGAIQERQLIEVN